jgi:hypothetical protein
MRYSKPVGKTKEKASVTAVPGRQVLYISLITDEIFFLYHRLIKLIAVISFSCYFLIFIMCHCQLIASCTGSVGVGGKFDKALFVIIEELNIQTTLQINARLPGLLSIIKKLKMIIIQHIVRVHSWEGEGTGTGTVM